MAGGTPGPKMCLVRRRNCSEDDEDGPVDVADAGSVDDASILLGPVTA